MKYTLLEIVQEILSDMDSDEVNSIDDTVESEQVARIVRSTFFAMMSNRNWPHLRQTITLEPSGNLGLPTHMKVPDKAKELILLNYDCSKLGQTKKVYKPMKWLEPDEFLRRQNSLNSDAANVDVITDVTGVQLLVKNDVAPSVYTSFDDTYVVFDSYDSAVDNTLKGPKTQAQASMLPSWSHVDDHVPDLPEEAFTALIEEAKSKASFKLNQVVDQKSEQEASRQQRFLSRESFKVHGGIKFPRYGRGSSKGKSTKNTTFKQGKY